LLLLASKNGERLAILSDEGGFFDILAGAPVRVDRKSGEPIFLTNPLLTIGLSPQPAVLSGLAEIPVFRGRGLLARFLFGLPPSNLGYRHHEPRQYQRELARTTPN